MMTDSQQSRRFSAVAAATAAVFVAGRRVGSAVLADERRLLTAGHVLRRAETTEGALNPVIEVEFPFTETSGTRALVPARQVKLDATAADVGVLDLVLDGGPPGWLPAPVALWAARRMPGRVSVLGFPREESALRGLWRDFDTAGPAADGTVQLDWVGEAGTLPGHSGGPVVDPLSGTLVGVLVQGSQAGRFDRFVPVTVIGRCCRGLPFPWLMAGADARGHFTRRSRGQRSRSRGGDLFRGRAAALASVGGWLTGPEGQGRPLVVTGQPGAGKSAVLARTVLDLEAVRAGPGLAFHARGATHDQLLAAVADLAGAEQAGTRDELLEALEDKDGSEPVMIAVDALDEAASGPDRREIAATLTELAAVPRVRVVVATRPLAVGHRYLAGKVLSTLGISAADDPALVDLDTDRYFEPEGLRQFAGAVLTQHQARHPGPDGAAWTAYRDNPALCARLARVIAARADRNYLVAAMAAVPLSAARQPTDPEAPGFDPADIPSEVGEALGKYLEQLPESQQSRTRALLTALAYARGGGLDDRSWIAFAGALGYQASAADLDQLRAGTAADYLLQTIPNDSGPVTRLFHQALADELLAPRHQLSDERALMSSLRPAPGESWATSSDYALAHVADHASSARQLLGLLDDPGYLAHADLARLAALLSLDPDSAADPIAIIVRQVAARANPLPPPRRARLLALTAAHFGLPDLRHRLAAACDQLITPVWAHSLGSPHMELTGHASAVAAVAIGRAGDRDVIVSGSRDGTVRLWDAATGESIGRPLTGQSDWVDAVAIGRAGDRDVIVSGSRDRTVRLWDAATGESIGRPLTGHGDWVTSVAIGRAGDRDVIVSGSRDRTVRLWDAATGQPIGELIVIYGGAVEAVAIGRAGDRDIIVSGSRDSQVRVWDAATRHPIGRLVNGGTVAIGRVGGRDIIVSASHDHAVALWDVATGESIGRPLTGHSDGVTSVAIGRAGDRDVIVSGSRDNTVRLWDVVTGESIGRPLTGHSDGVTSVAIGRAGDRDVIASGSRDGTVRIWDVAIGRIPGGPLTGHGGVVEALAIGRAGDRSVIVSGSRDRMVRLWDVASGQPIGRPLTGHGDSVTAVAIGRAGDHNVIASGSRDGMVRVWDAATRQPVGRPLTHAKMVAAVAIGRAGDRDVIASGSWDNTVRLWDAASGQPIGEPLTGHTNTVEAVAIGRAGDWDVIVSGSRDNTVRLWDATTGQPIGEPLTGHTNVVTAVAIGRAGDWDVIVSGSRDNTVRLWDATTGQPIGEPFTGHSDWVAAVAIGRAGDRDVIASASHDNTLRIWDFTEGQSLVVDLLGGARSTALAKDGQILCVSAGHTICLFNA